MLSIIGRTASNKHATTGRQHADNITHTHSKSSTRVMASCVSQRTNSLHHFSPHAKQATTFRARPEERTPTADARLRKGRSDHVRVSNDNADPATLSKRKVSLSKWSCYHAAITAAAERTRQPLSGHKLSHVSERARTVPFSDAMTGIKLKPVS